MAVRSGVGCSVARIGDHVELFGEAAGRAVLCIRPDDAPGVLARCEAAGVPVARLGVATGDRISVKGMMDIALDEATSAWRDRLPLALGVGTTHG